MLLIQGILIAVIALIVSYSLLRFKKNEISGRRLVVWLAFWLAAAVVVAWPELTVKVANFVGIGRGSDLVMYGSVMFLFYALFRLLIRIERLEKNLTKLVRQTALEEYDEKK
jgi:small membrane protein